MKTNNTATIPFFNEELFPQDNIVVSCVFDQSFEVVKSTFSFALQNETARDEALEAFKSLSFWEMKEWFDTIKARFTHDEIVLLDSRYSVMMHFHTEFMYKKFQLSDDLSEKRHIKLAATHSDSKRNMVSNFMYQGHSIREAYSMASSEMDKHYEATVKKVERQQRVLNKAYNEMAAWYYSLQA